MTGHMAKYVSVASSRSMSITAVAIKFPKHRDSAGQYLPLWDFQRVNGLCRGSVKDSMLQFCLSLTVFKHSRFQSLPEMCQAC